MASQPRIFQGIVGIRAAVIGACAALALAACGGSDGGPLTGQFVDDPVANLRYSTATQSGNTNGTGDFHYLPGEVVSFFVGDILVGQAVGGATLTPFDLAGIAPPAIPVDLRRALSEAGRFGSDPSPFERALNIARFLQSLDADGNPATGIEIPAAIHGLAAGRSIVFDAKMLAFAGYDAFTDLMAGRSAPPRYGPGDDRCALSRWRWVPCLTAGADGAGFRHFYRGIELQHVYVWGDPTPVSGIVRFGRIKNRERRAL